MRDYDNRLDDWVTLRSRTYPSRPAIYHGGATLTYAELDALAARCARRLAALGARPGGRVATTLPPGIDFAALLHAVPRLGAALVPLNTRLTTAERRWQIEDCATRLVVEEPLDGAEADIQPRSSVDPGETFVLLYTSGTTSQPKRVELSYGNFNSSALASAWNLGVRSDDRWLCVMPLFHVGGLSILTRSAIYGTAAVIHDGFDVEATRRSLESGEATLVSLVATMLRRLIEGGLARAPRLRAALVGGGPVPRDLLEWATEHGLPAFQTYGMTETTSQIATLQSSDAIWKTGAAGKPLLGVELRTGAGGEILVRGAMVARGALSEDGWLHTGDRGRLDSDGYLYVDGRIADVIVTGGENVAAAEVEEALVSHPAVSDAAVVGRPDPEWGEIVTAFVVATDLTDDELLEHCRARLARYKVPRTIERLSEIPRTASGKVLRARLETSGVR